MKSLVSRHVLAVSLAALVGLHGAGRPAHGQGSIYGTGDGVSPGGRDAHWNIVAYPTGSGSNGFTPPAGQTAPYAAYVPTSVPTSWVGGASNDGFDGTRWITPQSTADSLVTGHYNWIVSQTFTVATTQLYRFNFSGAGDNELEFFIDGTIDTTDAKRPVISGGTRIGPKAGDYSYITNFSGGATVTAGTHVAYMVLWDYGGSTGALIGPSNFVIPTQYWAPDGSGAGGTGTWYANGGDSSWATNANGTGTKTTWYDGNVQIARFGGSAGTVNVEGQVVVNQMYFDTTGYVVQASPSPFPPAQIAYAGASPTMTVGGGQSVAISAPQYNPGGGLTVTGGGTAAFNANFDFGGDLVASNATVNVTGTNLGFGNYVAASNGRLTLGDGITSLNVGTVSATSGGVVTLAQSTVANTATVHSGGTVIVNGSVMDYVDVKAGGSIGGSGLIFNDIRGAGTVSPGNSPGILTTGSVDPTSGLKFTFEFSGTTPNYGSPTSSVNDVLRLTSPTSPFAAPLTSANSKTLFLNFTKAELTLGTGSVSILEGGFFTDAATDFLSLLANNPSDNGGFQAYVLGDGNGTDNALNGQGYYNWRNPSMFGWTQSLFLSTTPVTAGFATGEVSGQVMLLSVAVPEPSTYAMGLGAAGVLGLMRVRRGRRATPTAIA